MDGLGLWIDDRRLSASALSQSLMHVQGVLVAADRHKEAFAVQAVLEHVSHQRRGPVGSSRESLVRLLVSRWRIPALAFSCELRFGSNGCLPEQQQPSNRAWFPPTKPVPTKRLRGHPLKHSTLGFEVLPAIGSTYNVRCAGRARPIRAGLATAPRLASTDLTV